MEFVTYYDLKTHDRRNGCFLSCIAAQASQAFDKYRFTTRYPWHCKTCGGWGELQANDDLCPDCVGFSPTFGDFHMVPCPRCSQAIKPDAICHRCGWSLQDPNRGIPLGHDCACHELHMDRLLFELGF